MTRKRILDYWTLASWADKTHLPGFGGGRPEPDRL